MRGDAPDSYTVSVGEVDFDYYKVLNRRGSLIEGRVYRDLEKEPYLWGINRSNMYALTFYSIWSKNPV